jgi:FIMAH domain-containing protein
MMPRILLVVAAVSAASAYTAEAQQLTFDAASRNYRLTYHSDDLDRDVTVSVEPPNKVDPRLGLVAARRLGDGKWEYQYRLTNLATPGATQPLGDFEMACAAQANATAPPGWSVMVSDIDRSSRGFSCTFSELNAGGVAPGSSLDGFVVRTTWLPAIMPGKFWGSAPPVAFPDGDGEHEPAVHDLIKSVNGVRGGWVSGSVIAPAREVAAVTTDRLVQTALGDLSRACGTLGWITATGICNSLQVKLEHAALALQAGDASAARARLETFVSELDAQRGKHVPESGYWLLWTNAQEALSRLP